MVTMTAGFLLNDALFALRCREHFTEFLKINGSPIVDINLLEDGKELVLLEGNTSLVQVGVETVVCHTSLAIFFNGNGLKDLAAHLFHRFSRLGQKFLHLVVKVNVHRLLEFNNFVFEMFVGFSDGRQEGEGLQLGGEANKHVESDRNKHNQQEEETIWRGKVIVGSTTIEDAQQTQVEALNHDGEFQQDRENFGASTRKELSH
mmetsp:Transcript_27770/g.54676  ORF Transcript_27770/g.54676 Transcript_27770/m.54676 type:complete len:204 (-) Transcript_27770:1107-1718(-)